MRLLPICLSLTVALGCPARKVELQPGQNAPETAPDTPRTPLPSRGEPCPKGACTEGLSCLRYYGFAGPRGPELSSCERPCPKRTCPVGEHCATVADGPGQVCQPD